MIALSSTGQIYEQVVDWYTISLTQGSQYSALSESGSSRVGSGSAVQICGWGEFLGIPIYTEYPYLCKRGEGLVFGVTSHGWVHLYGSGEIASTSSGLPGAASTRTNADTSKPWRGNPSSGSMPSRPPTTSPSKSFCRITSPRPSAVYRSICACRRSRRCHRDVPSRG